MTQMCCDLYNVPFVVLTVSYDHSIFGLSWDTLSFLGLHQVLAKPWGVLC